MEKERRRPGGGGEGTGRGAALRNEVARAEQTLLEGDGAGAWRALGTLEDAGTTASQSCC